MLNLIKNIISISLILIGIFGFFIAILQYAIIFIWNGLIHTQVNFWGLWFVLLFIVGVFIIILGPKNSDLSKNKIK